MNTKIIIIISHPSEIALQDFTGQADTSAVAPIELWRDRRRKTPAAAEAKAGRQTLKIIGNAFITKINEFLFAIKGLSHSPTPLRGAEIQRSWIS